MLRVCYVEVFPQVCREIAPLGLWNTVPCQAWPYGMVFTHLKENDLVMNDILLVIATFAGTYLSSLAFVIVLTRLIFPFKTKEEMAADDIRRIEAQPQITRKRHQVMLPLLKRHGHLALNR